MRHAVELKLLPTAVHIEYEKKIHGVEPPDPLISRGLERRERWRVLSLLYRKIPADAHDESVIAGTMKLR